MDALQQIEDLHSKADSSKDGQERLHAEMIGVRADLEQQDIRVTALESTCREHTELHTGTLLRVAELEKQVKDLRDGQRERGRSPARLRRSIGREIKHPRHVIAHPAAPEIVTLLRTFR